MDINNNAVVREGFVRIATLAAVLAVSESDDFRVQAYEHLVMLQAGIRKTATLAGFTDAEKVAARERIKARISKMKEFVDSVGLKIDDAVDAYFDPEDFSDEPEPTG